MKLSVIIVNYNVQYFLEQALLSVRKAAAMQKVEIFVVDNNSVDESVQMLREKFQEVHLIANKHNAGFSKANNQAMRLARGEYVLLQNPDTVVEEDTFEKCLAFMDVHPEAGGLGVKMIDGSGKFLPESKRGFPSPFVAFCKTFGLSRLFPQSRIFNRYHLGYLDKDATNEVEVLAGAFLLLRRKVLDEIGLLDEAFFMYGEDIDLSYRIIQAGYKNYYFSDTTIIHYKGESTKKGSLNYVRVFYNAMIIFAKKHFKGQRAKWFILMLQAAIYLRAFITLLGSVFRKAYLPVLDAVLIFVGLVFLKDFWATNYYNNPNYFQSTFFYFNVPLYIALWVGAVFFSGGYDEPFNIRRLSRGLLFGTLLLAAVYGFLPLHLRPSRALILLGSIWAIMATIALRTLVHFLKFGNFNVGKDRPKNLVIVGSNEESVRVQNLLHQVPIQKNFIGTVAPSKTEDSKTYLSSISQLDEVVHIYKIDEIIFCSHDVSSQDIMRWMTLLGPEKEYKIVPEESLSIIGSSSKNSGGELYTIDIQFNIAMPMARRNKRVLDLSLAIGFLATFPIIFLFVKRKAPFLKNIFAVFFGKKTWVGFEPLNGQAANLPVLREGILSPLDALQLKQVNEPTAQRLNFLYAKDYGMMKDLEIIWKGFRELGKGG